MKFAKKRTAKFPRLLIAFCRVMEDRFGYQGLPQQDYTNPTRWRVKR